MDISNSLTKLGHRALFVARKYAPEILTGVGIIGLAGAGVLAAKQTLKLEETVSNTEARLQLANYQAENGSDRRVVVKAYLQNTGDFVKLYGGPVSLALASIVAILGAHGIMRRRNAALVAAYGVLETAFTNYRARVAEAIGEEKEEELYRGIRTETVEQKGTGKKTKVKVLDKDKLSPYAVMFDEDNRYFEKAPGYNKSFLILKQNHFNDLLQARGYVFLNEVYRDLGFPETQAGQAVGWALKNGGDNYIDFRLLTREDQDVFDFSENILVDPNVDGPILGKLPEGV